MYKMHIPSLLGLMTILLQVSCHKTPSSHPLATPSELENKSAIAGEHFEIQKISPLITVTNLKGEPMKQAKVLLGDKVGQPFGSNLLETDQLGQIIAPKDWTSPLSVTVNYPGYMRVTYYHVAPQNLNFKLRPLVKLSQIPLSGKTTQFGTIKPDNKADFGLVIQSITLGDLFSFNIDKLISPESDTLKVAGIVETAIPSNITFPRQQESYVFPITLEKEKYRLYFSEPGLHRSYALHGQVPFKETIDKFRNKVPFTTIINSFHFISGSIKEFQLDGPLELDLPVNEMAFNSKESIQPPPIPSNLFMLSISLFEKNGQFYPTDMHKVEDSKPFYLKSIDTTQKHFLSVLANDPNQPKTAARQEASSIEFVPQTHNHQPRFLDLIPAPTTPTTTGWSAQTPEVIEGITPLTTFSVLSKVITENGKRKKIQREWEVYAEQWTPDLLLPEWPEAAYPLDTETTTLAESHRWEIVYIGTQQKRPLPAHSSLGPNAADFTSHVSFNSVEF